MDKNACILIIDDDPVVLMQLSTMIKRLGVAKVGTSQNAREALAIIARGDPLPQLLIVDLNMPEMDGVEFARELASQHYPGGVIMVSGEQERTLQAAEKLFQAHGLNVAGSLCKPVAPQELMPLLRAIAPAQNSTRNRTDKEYGVEELERAITGGQLLNHYQPKVDLASGKVVGVETLVRWNHPRDGLIYPDQFIALAEEHGLINALTRAVINAALIQAGGWRTQGIRLKVAINVSMKNLDALDFPDEISRCASEAGVDPEDVILEITESYLMTDLRSTLDVLTRLRLKRFVLSIDDFGTGHSSLSQLRDIPFDELKVDRGFVHKAWQDETRRAIYEASLGMAKKLGMQVVGEGVETEQDWDFLCRSGCDLAQGYFIAKPMPAEALAQWLQEWCPPGVKSGG
ncbi:MAG: EAL domain-containing response regulator [Gammaproteobacteria bacterium]|nr:EAL domain-containing response regulator [Gammaproteobacteria bacterium]